MTDKLVIDAVMTEKPFAVESTLEVKAAQKIMIEGNFRHLPVVKNGRVEGVVSDRGILMAQVATHDLEGDLQIGDVCRLDPYIVEPGTALSEVLETMVERHLGAALVADNGKLVGIYTATDGCRDLARALQAQSL